MFTIDSNQVIRISKGDDAEFPIFLNKGTALKPSRYVIKKDSGCELYFYIFEQHEYTEPIYSLTIKASDDNATNNEGDFVMLFSSNDEKWVNLEAGEYLYVIKAKIFNFTRETFETNTVTNRLPIYIIEDDYSRREWDDKKSDYVYGTLNKKITIQAKYGDDDTLYLY